MVETIKWEYRLETFGTIWSGLKDEELQNILDAWGEEGWDVFTVYKPGSSDRVTVVAKRPLSDRTRRERSRPT
jgi:hypothetical protein